MAILESDPVPLFMWIGKNWILRNMEFVVLNGRLSLYLDRDWKHDPLVEDLDYFENPLIVANEAVIPEVNVIDSDSDVEENGKEGKIIGSDNEDSNTIVISSNDKVSNDWNRFTSEEEGNSTKSESEIDGPEVSSCYGTLSFEDWIELNLASSPKVNDKYWRSRLLPDQDLKPSLWLIPHSLTDVYLIYNLIYRW